jgi:GT2 family glycosyltransferase
VTLAPRCVAVIPTRDAGDPLMAALDSMGPAWRAACVIADNGAPADAIRAITERFPEPAIVPLGSNVGFARAVARGIARGTADGKEFAVVLNDDLVIDPPSLEALVQALVGDPHAGSAAGVLLDGDSSSIDTAGVRCDAGLGSSDLGRGLRVGELDPSAPPLGPSGGFAAYRLTALVEVGSFDEQFFAYYEDLDLALRLQAAGWRCSLALDAVGRHIGSATLGWRSVEKAVLVGRSRGRIARKYGVHRHPRAWPSLLLELVAGLVVSFELRSFAPLQARVAGFLAASTECRYPAALVEPTAVSATIARRLSRRYGRSATSGA